MFVESYAGLFVVVLEGLQLSISAATAVVMANNIFFIGAFFFSVSNYFITIIVINYPASAIRICFKNVKIKWVIIFTLPPRVIGIEELATTPPQAIQQPILSPPPQKLFFFSSRTICLGQLFS